MDAFSITCAGPVTGVRDEIEDRRAPPPISTRRVHNAFSY